MAIFHGSRFFHHTIFSKQLIWGQDRELGPIPRRKMCHSKGTQDLFGTIAARAGGFNELCAIRSRFVSENDFSEYYGNFVDFLISANWKQMYFSGNYFKSVKVW